MLARLIMRRTWLERPKQSAAFTCRASAESGSVGAATVIKWCSLLQIILLLLLLSVLLGIKG